MHIPPHSLLRIFLIILIFTSSSHADVGTASFYSPPYVPTVCYGSDTSQFPPDNLFAAAGDGIWDNDASCGRGYLVRCLSSATPGACIDNGPIIQITIVDQASELNSSPSVNGTSLVLSETAFQMIANKGSANEINIELTQIPSGCAHLLILQIRHVSIGEPPGPLPRQTGNRPGICHVSPKPLGFPPLQPHGQPGPDPAPNGSRPG